MGMLSYRKKLFFHLPQRRGFVNITPQVAAALAESGIRAGLCLVNGLPRCVKRRSRFRGAVSFRGSDSTVGLLRGVHDAK